MMSNPALSDILAGWITENFKNRIWLESGQLKANGTINGFMDIRGGPYQVVFGAVNDLHPFVRSRGRYFYPYEPDFFDRLKIELEECCINPEINWAPNSHATTLGT